MKSILQANRSRCWLCGRYGSFADPIDEHHVFFGPYRQKSEKYGLKVYLHHFSCHIFGENAVHVNADVRRNMQERAQTLAMLYYGWSVSEFREIFGRNYIRSDDRCAVCGEIVPEGRQVCPRCEMGTRGNSQG